MIYFRERAETNNREAMEDEERRREKKGARDPSSLKAAHTGNVAVMSLAILIRLLSG